MGAKNVARGLALASVALLVWNFFMLFAGAASPPEGGAPPWAFALLILGGGVALLGTILSLRTPRAWVSAATSALVLCAYLGFFAAGPLQRLAAQPEAPEPDVEVLFHRDAG